MRVVTCLLPGFDVHRSRNEGAAGDWLQLRMTGVGTHYCSG